MKYFAASLTTLFLWFGPAIFGSLSLTGSVFAEFTGTLTIAGSPSAAGSATGTTWTYSGTDDGVVYRLYGSLYTPGTVGTYPAAILNHGYTGSPENLSFVAATMRGWRMIVVAPKLAHAGDDSGCPTGSCAPSGTNDIGASIENYKRIQKTFEVLQHLPSSYGTVDISRVAIHGVSAGAFATTGTVDLYPTRYKVASHTGGGVCLSGCPNFTPTASEYDNIIVPYSIHHGDADTIVPLSWDADFDSILTSRSVAHEFNVYPGLDHIQAAYSPEVLSNLKMFYDRYLFTATDTTPPKAPTGLRIVY